MLEKCNCEDYKSPAAGYQNKKYGTGMRVVNPRKSGGHTCTVCGKQTGPKAAAAPKAAK
jgi:hypothetical protein